MHISFPFWFGRKGQEDEFQPCCKVHRYATCDLIAYISPLPSPHPFTNAESIGFINFPLTFPSPYLPESCQLVHLHGSVTFYIIEMAYIFGLSTVIRYKTMHGPEEITTNFAFVLLNQRKGSCQHLHFGKQQTIVFNNQLGHLVPTHIMPWQPHAECRTNRQIYSSMLPKPDWS